MKKHFRWGGSARSRSGVAVGMVVLAFLAIVLARTPSTAEAVVAAPEVSMTPPVASGGGVPTVPPPVPAGADRVAVVPMATGAGPRAVIETPELNGFLALTQGAVLAGGARTQFGELRLTATEAGRAERRPVALAVVLDVSGSMIGDKISSALRSIDTLLETMRDGDQVAIVTYSDSASWISELTPVTSARRILHQRLAAVEAGGGTNIPAGLELGSLALANAPSTHVRRLILISDGIDNSGIPLEMVQREVVERAQVGTVTSALGVGTDYDERFLTSVADAGRGGYEFLSRGGELARFLRRELDQAATTVVTAASLDLALPNGWRLAEVYGGTAEGSRVPIGAIFAGERRRVTMRFEVQPGAVGTAHELGAALRYRAVLAEIDRNLPLARLSVVTVGDEAQLAAATDAVLHAESVAQHLERRQRDAIDAWRGGEVGTAQQIARENLAELDRLEANAPAAASALSPQRAATRADLDNFGMLNAQSGDGRAWGLGSNGHRRARERNY